MNSVVVDNHFASNWYLICLIRSSSLSDMGVTYVYTCSCINPIITTTNYFSIFQNLIRQSTLPFTKAFAYFFGKYAKFNDTLLSLLITLGFYIIMFTVSTEIFAHFFY